MAHSLFQHEAIRTTEPKAKELRSFVEHMINIAKRGTLAARRLVLSEMCDRRMADNEGEIQEKSVVQKLFDEIAPRYASRNGGYTRIIHLAQRRIGDAGSQVLMQLVEATKAESTEAATGTSRRRRRAAKRRQAAEQGAPAAAEAPAEAPAAEEPKKE